MISKNTLVKITFLFSLIGVLFSGFLTFSKFFSQKCVLTEGCAYFLGYPTCVYGFIIFLAIFIPSALALFSKKYNPMNLMKIVFYVSIIGIVFSVYYTIVEIWITPLCAIGECQLILPSCVYGLFMYIIIFIASVLYMRQK